VIVDEAVERNPCKKPRVVEVETPHVVGVQAKAAPVLSSVSQPKIPPVQVTNDPEAQVVRPKPVILVPERLVVEAVVAKRLVVVALLDVELTAVKFWRVVEPLERMLAKVPRPVEVMLPPLAVV
jgi:hypothetical protein